MKGGERLSVLILEDNPEDAELERHELTRAGFTVDVRREETEAGYLAALEASPDLILADFSLPRFDGLRALKLMKDRGLDIPFVLVSGAIGEEKAVEVMLAGASAYVMKARMASLGPIAARALKEAELRRENIETHAELRKSERRYRRIFETSQDGLLELDAATGAVLDANPALLALLGCGLPEIVGRAPWELEAFAEVGSARVDLRELLSNPRVRYDDLPLTAKDGRRIDVEFTAHYYSADGGTGIQCSLRDITERKRLQAQFAQAQKMESIGMLAGGIAHDFNNILTTIMAAAGFLGESLTAKDPRRADVKEIEDAAARAAALTRQLLIFSRKQLIQPVVLDLNVLIRNLEKMLRRLIGEDIKMELSLCPEPALVRADPGQMEQVIMNLSVNAREAMQKGGCLGVKTDILKDAAGCLPRCRPGSARDCVRLEVSDTGCGMPPEVLARLFEPFFTTRAPGKGTGLGLSTVYGIVTAADGDVAVRSVVGRGSTFTLCLPMADAKVEHPQGGGEAPRSDRGRETILLVEDDESVLRLNERVLRERGYRVLSARSGEAALAVLRDPGDRVSLLLTDVVMAGMSGGDLAKKAAELQPGLKVVFATGYIDESRVDKIKALRGEVLYKPISPQALAQRVREVLDR